MNLDDFRVMQELYNAMINPEDEKEELYSAGGWPSGYYGPDDLGFTPQWMPLYNHLWNEMIETLRADGITAEHPKFEELMHSWLERWRVRVIEEWQRTLSLILNSNKKG